jgi:hypothetical protein
LRIEPASKMAANLSFQSTYSSMAASYPGAKKITTLQCKKYIKIATLQCFYIDQGLR